MSARGPGITGVVRIRVAKHQDGWRAEVPGIPMLYVCKFATRVAAIEALRLEIVKVGTAFRMDEVLLRLDEPYTEDK